MFLIDANVLITAHNLYYPTNRFPEFWDWTRHHAHAGNIKMPRQILDEVKKGTGNAEKDKLIERLGQDDIADCLLLKEDADLDAVQGVIAAYGADLTEQDLINMGQDPFLIASALVDPRNRSVVTTEKSKPTLQKGKRKIPDVCDTLGLQWLDTFRLLRELDFTTDWEQRMREEALLQAAAIFDL